MKKNSLSFIWPWIEPIVVILVGLVLYFPLHRENIAEMLWALGFFNTFGSLSTSALLKKELESVQKMSEILDLSKEAHVPQIREILRLYSAISEPEFSLLKNEIIDNTILNLTSLSHDKISGEMTGSKYHVWLLEVLQQAKKGEKICAVSVVPEHVWFKIPAEEKFLSENIKAVQRGIKIDRVFISSRKRLQEKQNQKVIKEHIRNNKYGLTAHISWVEDLEKSEPELLKEIGFGFILFGNRVLFTDTSIPPSEAKGQVLINQIKISYYSRLFDRLILYSAYATDELIKKIENTT